MAGVAAVGILGGLAVNGIQSKSPGSRVSTVLNVLNLNDQSFQMQVALIGALAAGLLIGRTLLSVLITRKTLFFLGSKSSQLTEDLVSKFLAKDLSYIQSHSSQKVLYSLTFGVSTVTLIILGTTISLISDIFLVIFLAIGLFAVDPIVALSTFTLFGFVGIILYQLMNKRAKHLGQESAQLIIQSSNKVIEVITSYRESIVQNRRSYYADAISKDRERLANVSAEMAFMPNISKYIIEMTIIIGALGISAIQFLLQDATHAVATLTLFMAAGSRLAPAMLRIQQGALQIKGGLGTAGPTLDLIEDLKNAEKIKSDKRQIKFEYPGFIPNVSIRDITYSYPGTSGYSLKVQELDISSGSTLAIVGPSGSGKTTLVDLILGVLEIDSGEVLISGLPPKAAIQKWPGSISYVPQDVFISDGTIRENLTLGFPADSVDESDIWEAIEKAQLLEFVKAQPEKLEAQVGERGTQLSGGQRQRLGIARALLTNPKLIVLDEATSALDGNIEADFTSAISRLQGSVTVILIAHRLATIAEADSILYLDQGKVVMVGTFDQLRADIPNFEKQVTLANIKGQ
ncbi:ABC transporter ATP-binding protein [Candidatus Planktophila dulcis]|uniref:ABC transporter ATP-binding protein n=1 Tax=Candidatus Planktophila dulcis TaxID=1884914 RepID=UPI003CF3F03D